MRLIFEVEDKDSEEVREAVEKMKLDGEVEKLNAVCFWLIKMCSEMNSMSAKIVQENVVRFGSHLGTWEIKIKKI